MTRPQFSVCIPAYNRPEVLPDLLASIIGQDFDDYEIVICEDRSPRREEIRAVAERFMAEHPDRIRYFENAENLGYDANLRELIEKARGEYVFFMGNDDLMRPGALKTVAAALRRHPDIGVVLRSYAAFEGSPENIVRTARYFEEETFFPAGAPSVITFFRRSVVIPGVVLHRDSAAELATDRFDGTTLYQLHLVGNIMLSRNGVFIPEILVLYRDGGIPEFGTSARESGRYVPGAHTTDGSVTFMEGMLEIARDIEKRRGARVYRGILMDVANYSTYPLLLMHSQKPLRVFLPYVVSLAKLGFWRSPFFFAYCLLLLTLGPRRVPALVEAIKLRLGHTPVIGGVYKGESVR